MRRPSNSERGSALVVSMMLIVVLATITHSVTLGTRLSVDATVLERGRVEALAAADGGVALARLRLASDPSWSGEHVTVGRSDVEIVVREGEADTRVVHTVATSPVRGEAGQPVRAVVDVVLDARPGLLPVIVSWREMH